jgi:hypothetical protein
MPPRFVSGLPSLFWAGGVRLTVADPAALIGAVTLMPKAGSALEACPSLTLMTMLL